MGHDPRGVDDGRFHPFQLNLQGVEAVGEDDPPPVGPAVRFQHYLPVTQLPLDEVDDGLSVVELLASGRLLLHVARHVDGLRYTYPGLLEC